jgi:hypothetical protein
MTYDAIRSLPSTRFYGSITKSPSNYRFFFSSENNPLIVRLFKTEKDVNLVIALRNKDVYVSLG